SFAGDNVVRRRRALGCLGEQQIRAPGQRQNGNRDQESASGHETRFSTEHRPNIIEIVVCSCEGVGSPTTEAEKPAADLRGGSRITNERKLAGADELPRISLLLHCSQIAWLNPRFIRVIRGRSFSPSDRGADARCRRCRRSDSQPSAFPLASL